MTITYSTKQSGKLNITFIAPLIVFIAIAIFLGVGLTLNPTDLPSTKINKPAPAFSLPTLFEQSTETSATFSPSQLKGERWILNVWASWCAACRVEHPLLNEIAAKTNIKLIGLNYKDKANDAREWLKQRGNPYFKIPTDIKGDVGIDWGVYGVPETFIIDENGIIIHKHTGPIDINDLNNDILPLFSDNAVKNQSGS